MGKHKAPPIYLSTVRQVDLQVLGIPADRCAPLPTMDTVNQYAGRDVVVLPAVEGEAEARIAIAALRSVKAHVIVSPVSYRWLELSTYSFDQVERVTQGLPVQDAQESRRHLVLDVTELFAQQCPEQKRLLGPIYEQDIGFLAAWRGTGKTLFSLSVAVAMASGLDFLGWECPEPVPVLYVDGEMPFPLLRAHLQTVLKTFGRTAKAKGIKPDPRMLRFITPDIQPDGVVPTLSTDVGRKRIEDALGASKYCVLDNLSCLVGGNAENDLEEWEPIRGFQLGLRRGGVAHTLVHHMGKSGDQRGHSSKEDILDWSLRLERPTDHDPTFGAKFVMRFAKLRRGLEGMPPMEVHLTKNAINGDVEWAYKHLGQAVDEMIVRLAMEGHTQRDIVTILKENGFRASLQKVNNVLRQSKGQR